MNVIELTNEKEIRVAVEGKTFWGRQALEVGALCAIRLRQAPREVVLEMPGVRFIDSGTVLVLLDLVKSVEAAATSIRIEKATDELKKLVHNLVTDTYQVPPERLSVA